jgi:hypothetical protein
MPTSLALACALAFAHATGPDTVDASAPVSATSPAPQDPLAAAYARYQALQLATGLDLASTWQRYGYESHRGEDFGRFAWRRFKRQRQAGIGMVIAGLLVGGAGLTLLLVAGVDGRDRDLDFLSGGLLAATGVTTGVIGGVLWKLNRGRLQKLRRAGVGARLLPGGGGLGVTVAF